MGFQPPGLAERQAAIGSLEGLPPVAQRALTPGTHFVPISSPGPGDWLSVQDEPGQSFDAFVALLTFHRAAGFEDEAQRVERRLASLEHPVVP